MSGSGYTAYTRPGRYDTYATLPTDGGSEDLPPTLYEQFVARVLESASTAATAAQSASASAERCTSSAAQAQTAARQASTSSSATAASTTQNLSTLLWDFFLHCCSKFCMVILFPAFRSLLYGEI